MKTQIDLWYEQHKDVEFAKLLQNPLLMQALNMLLMDKLQIGDPSLTIDQAALSGMFARGRQDFYVSILKLGQPQPLPPAPRQTRELLRTDQRPQQP